MKVELKNKNFKVNLQRLSKDCLKLEVLKPTMLDSYKNSTKHSLKKSSQVESKMIKGRNLRNIVKSDIIELLNSKEKRIMKKRMKVMVQMMIVWMNLMKTTMTITTMTQITKKKKNSKSCMSLQPKTKSLIDYLMPSGNKNTMQKINRKSKNKIN